MDEQYKALQDQIDELRFLLNKNKFSNLVVNETPVQFKRPSIFPKDETSIRTDTTASKGRIAIADEYGNTRYIPYFE